MVILSVGLLSLVVVQAYAARARNLNQNHLLATQRASSEIANIQERAKQDFSQEFRQAELELEDDMALTVEVVDNWQGSPTLKAVTVTVSYTSNHREKAGRVRLWTLLRRDG